jgi:diguanylate cyclase (GGDEF)-like protein
MSYDESNRPFPIFLSPVKECGEYLTNGEDRLLRLAKKAQNVIGIALAVFLLEAVMQMILRRNHAVAESAFAYTLLINLTAATIIDFYRGMHSFHLKAHWFLLGSGPAIYCFTVAWDIWAPNIFPHVPVSYLLSCVDLLTVCSMIPAFLLISLPAGRRYFRHFIWIDLVQVTMAAYLLYVVVLRALPFTPSTGASLDQLRLVHLVSLEGTCLATGMLLHLFAAVGRDEKRFFGAVAFSTLLGLAINSVFNRLIVLHPNEALYNVPSLAQNIFSMTLYFLLPAESPIDSPRPVGFLGDMINIASPALPSAALLALGITVEPHYHRLGIVAVVTAFLLFAARSAIYQRSFEQSQISLEKAQVRLEHMSYIDELTGVANRRAFENTLRLEWERSSRSGSPLSLILIDVDFFKQLNDSQGHQAGDACLASVAHALQDALPRKIDTLGRYGGDEFAVVLPSTEAHAAQSVADRLCEAIRQLAIPVSGTTAPKISVSLGISTCISFQGSISQLLLSAADEALYQAKAAGRNCWRFCDISWKQTAAAAPEASSS